MDLAPWARDSSKYAWRFTARARRRRLRGTSYISRRRGRFLVGRLGPSRRRAGGRQLAGRRRRASPAIARRARSAGRLGATSSLPDRRAPPGRAAGDARRTVPGRYRGFAAATRRARVERIAATGRSDERSVGPLRRAVHPPIRCTRRGNAATPAGTLDLLDPPARTGRRLRGRAARGAGLRRTGRFARLLRRPRADDRLAARATASARPSAGCWAPPAARCPHAHALVGRPTAGGRFEIEYIALTEVDASRPPHASILFAADDARALQAGGTGRAGRRSIRRSRRDDGVRRGARRRQRSPMRRDRAC
jgi:hypothetical protein